MTLSDSENREMVSIAAAMDADEPAAMFPSQLAVGKLRCSGNPGTLPVRLWPASECWRPEAPPAVVSIQSNATRSP
jgi:hypothetical protein